MDIAIIGRIYRKLKATDNPFELIRNKIYADILRSGWYRQLVVKAPKKALNLKWRAHHHHSFPWNNPRTLDEKIGWMQVNTDTSLWTLLSDKYEVREYVKKTVGESFLIPSYGVYDSVDDIDFDKLPDSFVAKCTHDSGSAQIVRDKSACDFEAIRSCLRKSLAEKLRYSTFEPHYLRIKPRVVIEELLQTGNNTGTVLDYKLWCINGEPTFTLLCYDRDESHLHNVTVDVYQHNPWKPMREYLSPMMAHQCFKDIPEPLNFKEMVNIARSLSKGFPAVRVDLYNINGKIYFGEMTFTGAAGDHYYFSDEAQLSIGEKIRLTPQ